MSLFLIQIVAQYGRPDVPRCVVSMPDRDVDIVPASLRRTVAFGNGENPPFHFAHCDADVAAGTICHRHEIGRRWAESRCGDAVVFHVRE